MALWRMSSIFSLYYEYEYLAAMRIRVSSNRDRTRHKPLLYWSNGLNVGRMGIYTFSLELYVFAKKVE